MQRNSLTKAIRSLETHVSEYTRRVSLLELPHIKGDILTSCALDSDVVILDPRLLGELKDIPDHVISQAVAVEEVNMPMFFL